jgi:hypothetical protein
MSTPHRLTWSELERRRYSPACISENAFPAMTADPDRESFCEFRVQPTVTRPGPVPLDGETVRQESLAEADHAPPRHP